MNKIMQINFKSFKDVSSYPVAPIKK